MTGSDGEGAEPLGGLEAIQGFDELEALDAFEVFEVFAGCALLDAFRIWGAPMIETFQSLALVLALPVT